MFCTKCGAELTGKEKYCPECGKMISEIIETGNHTCEKKGSKKMISGRKVVVQKSESAHGKNRTTRKPIAVIACIVFLIVAGIFIYQFIAGKMMTGRYLATVENEEGKVGYINEKGEEVIPCKYDTASYAWTEGLTVVAEKVDQLQDEDGNNQYKFGVINIKGEIIAPLQYDDCSIGNGFIALGRQVSVNRYGDPICDWAFMNSKGEWMTDFKYQFINSSCIVGNSNGLIIVSEATGELDEDGNPECNYGVINKDAEEIIPLKYCGMDIDPNFGNKGLFAVETKNGQGQYYGFVDYNNQEIIPFIYEHAYTFSNNGLAAVSKDGKWGYIDVTGETEIPFQYVSAESFSDNGLAFVEKEEGEYECINAKGETVIPNSRYQEYGNWYNAYWLEGGELALIYIETPEGERLHGIINKEGDVIIAPNSVVNVYGDDIFVPFADLSMYGDNRLMPFALSWEDEEYQFITQDGKILDNTYDYAGRFSEKGWCCVGRKIGINEDGSNRYQYSYVDENEKVVLELPEKYVGAGGFMPVY